MTRLMSLAASCVISLLVCITSLSVRPQDSVGPIEKQARPATADNPIPRQISSAEPSYPTEAGDSGLSVTTTLRATIDQTGRVVEIRITGMNVDLCRTPPADYAAALAAFRNTMIGALRQWRYEPPAQAPMAFYVQFTLGPGPWSMTPNSTEKIPVFNRVGRVSTEAPKQTSANATCDNPVRQSLTTEVLPGYSVRPDGRGSYRDGEDDVVAVANFALQLCTDRRTCSTFPEGQPLESSARTLIVDLGSPVAASGAKNFGVLSASAANFGAFWGQDPTRIAVFNGREGAAIRSVLDLAVGRTVESERVEIRFFLNGAQHILQFGPWTAGQFQSEQSGLNGNGTTRGTITRLTETRWRVRSGTDSVGRLWDNRNSSQPVDLGLYHVSFDVQFDRK